MWVGRKQKTVDIFARGRRVDGSRVWKECLMGKQNERKAHIK